MLPYIITAVVAVLISAIVVWLIAGAYHKSSAKCRRKSS